MKTIAQKHMLYTLYQSGDIYLLEVVCGTVGIFEIKIKLSELETKEFLKYGISWIDTMANIIRTHPEDYTARKVTNE